LFEAREQIDMWADVIEARMNAPAWGARQLVAEIDQYRTEQGWSPHGFGGEDHAAPDNGSKPAGAP
jgi:hypothetical protein